MDLSAYDYTLPDELIAHHPTPERSASRLLVLDGATGVCRHERFAQLDRELRTGDLLIVNDSRVIPARLFGKKDSSGGRVELLIERIESPRVARAQARSSKPLKPAMSVRLDGGAVATVLDRDEAFYRLEFDCDIDGYLDTHGHVPLPPYIERPDEPRDRERYQTVFAARRGSVAAPTAGLHFDAALIDCLDRAGVDILAVTLHVGAGTFQNLRAEQLRRGRLHSERIELSASVCARIVEAKRNGGRVIAVGTTSARTLEAAASTGELRPYTGETQLFIRPGYRFHVIDGLITNFHLPRSSLLLLVAALAGPEQVRTAYAEAIARRYRFYSYGDAMLAWPVRR